MGERIEQVQVKQAKASDPEVPTTEKTANEPFGDDALVSLLDSLR